MKNRVDWELLGGDESFRGFGDRLGWIFTPPEKEVRLVSRPVIVWQGKWVEAAQEVIAYGRRDPLSGGRLCITVQGKQMPFLSALAMLGWQCRETREVDTVRLLKTFLRLASVEAKIGEAVRKFVLDWGPLWQCSQHIDANCCFTPGLIVPNQGAVQRECRWDWHEQVELFRTKAREAEAFIRIINSMKEKKEIPLKQWRPLDPHGYYRQSRFCGEEVRLDGTKTVDKEWRRITLLRALNERLRMPNGPQPMVFWNSSKNQFQMTLDSGFGFLRAVWLQIAQYISGAPGLYKCDACSDWYQPKKKPKAGNRHFCIPCGEGGRASKRLWAREN
jgi:hypothetical protein